MRNRSSDKLDDRLHRPALVPEVIEILRRYEPTVIAGVLSRVLRRQGNGLIPIYLRHLFLKLVTGTVKENPLHQRRAIRLLFQLISPRLLQAVILPTFELIAHIADEPVCEVNESSLAILFSPVFFMDRDATTPAALADPLPIRLTSFMVSSAKKDFETHHSVARLFQIPTLFLEDCEHNLRAFTVRYISMMLTFLFLSPTIDTNI